MTVTRTRVRRIWQKAQSELPVIEERPTHTTGKIGAASRLQAFANRGGLVPFAAAREDINGQPAVAAAEPA
jgi:hypothetical protein